jgi:hypothetical protein
MIGWEDAGRSKKARGADIVCFELQVEYKLRISSCSPIQSDYRGPVSETIVLGTDLGVPMTERLGAVTLQSALYSSFQTTSVSLVHTCFLPALTQTLSPPLSCPSCSPLVPNPSLYQSSTTWRLQTLLD